MNLVSNFVVGFVALLHILFLVLEMFFWTKPLGRKIFGLKKEFAEESASLAKNQGLYNGFLAAGLIWSLVTNEFAFELKAFFLGCVIVAGIYGSLTVKNTILFIQALPAGIALALVYRF